MAYMLIFLLKNVSSFCICKSYSHFFSKNTCEFDTVLTRTVNILTTNEFVKLRMLWTTGPRMANNEDPDEATHLSHLDLYCLQKYLFWSSRLQGLRRMITL